MITVRMTRDQWQTVVAALTTWAYLCRSNNKLAESCDATEAAVLVADVLEGATDD